MTPSARVARLTKVCVLSPNVYTEARKNLHSACIHNTCGGENNFESHLVKGFKDKSKSQNV